MKNNTEIFTEMKADYLRTARRVFSSLRDLQHGLKHDSYAQILTVMADHLGGGKNDKSMELFLISCIVMENVGSKVMGGIDPGSPDVVAAIDEAFAMPFEVSGKLLEAGVDIHKFLHENEGCGFVGVNDSLFAGFRTIEHVPEIVEVLYETPDKSETDYLMLAPKRGRGFAFRGVPALPECMQRRIKNEQYLKLK
ncbi:MAG: hypothetical protein FWD15_00565 [Alphaproteobacteria bacterium]|nr:hypothetical protein [Alphaproteobacteria bacterium]